MDNSPNPYQTPTALPTEPSTTYFDQSRFVPGVIAFLMVFAALVGVLSIPVPAVGEFTNPRFGWIGLILCLNPLIFLSIWLKSPSKPTLMAAAFMTLTVGVLNAVQLLIKGTVSEVTNSFTDLLHSAWYWSVLPFIVAGLYLLWHALGMKPASIENSRPPSTSNKPT
jgi:hypothetical protein